MNLYQDFKTLCCMQDGKGEHITAAEFVKRFGTDYRFIYDMIEQSFHDTVSPFLDFQFWISSVSVCTNTFEPDAGDILEFCGDRNPITGGRMFSFAIDYIRDIEIIEFVDGYGVAIIRFGTYANKDETSVIELEYVHSSICEAMKKRNTQAQSAKAAGDCK